MPISPGDAVRERYGARQAGRVVEFHHSVDEIGRCRAVEVMVAVRCPVLGLRYIWPGEADLEPISEAELRAFEHGGSTRS